MSKFVSGGTIDEPVQRDDEWLEAQQEIEANRRRKEEEGRQEGGRSLYETLQANKAAKQEAFEESIRLKNQFRSLDEDEVEFLDAVLESTRAKELAIRKETVEQLDLFRKQQEQVEKASSTEPDKEIHLVGEEQWVATGRKRKKLPEKPVLKGVKRRKSSSTAADHSQDALTEVEAKNEAVQRTGNDKEQDTSTVEKRVVLKAAAANQPATTSSTSVQSSPTTKAPMARSPGLGLSSYSSDEDE